MVLIRLLGGGGGRWSWCSLANADGSYLVVPQQGTLHLTTEMGLLVRRAVCGRVQDSINA